MSGSFGRKYCLYSATRFGDKNGPKRRLLVNVSIEMLQSMIHDRGGPSLTDEALEGVLVHVRFHQAQGEKLRQLDLSKMLPLRMMRVDTVEVD